MSKKAQKISNSPFLQNLIPVFMILLMGFIFSFYLYKNEVSSQRLKIQNEFQEFAKDQIASIKTSLDKYIQALEHVEAFYAASSKVERDEFREFVKPALRNLNGIQALEWVPRVRDTERKAYENLARKEVFSEFSFTEKNSRGETVRAGKREEYFPVYYLEPLRGNEAGLGFDLASSPARAQALQFSRESGKMAATAPLTLVQEKERQKGFFLALPFHGKAKPVSSPGEKGEPLVGFILGTFRVGDIVKEAIPSQIPPHIRLRITDIKAPQGKDLFYDYPALDEKEKDRMDAKPEKSLEPATLEVSEKIPVANREWEVSFTTSKDYVSRQGSSRPLNILFIGLLFTAIAAGYMFIGMKRPLSPLEERTDSLTGTFPSSVPSGGVKLRQVFSFFLIVGALSWFALGKIEAHIKKEVGSKLEVVLKTTREALKVWSHDRMDDLSFLASNPELRLQIKNQLARLRAGEDILHTPELAYMRSLMKVKLNAHGDLGFFVISPDYVNIGSMRDANMGKVNLVISRGPYLKRIFKGKPCLIPPLYSDVPLPNIKGVLSPHEPTMFIGVPVFDGNGNVMAALTIRMDPSRDFSRIILLARMGKSGETYAFDEEARLLTESRFNEQLRSFGILGVKERGILSVSIRDPGGNMLEGHRPSSDHRLPLTKMAQDALQGRSGIDLEGYRDYRGIPVVGAWLWDKELDLGLTSEMDVEEAFSGLYSTRRIVLFLLGITLTLALAFTFRLRKSLVESEILRDRAQRSDAYNQALLDGTTYSIISTKTDGLIQTFNKGAEKMLGYSEEEVLNKVTPAIIHDPEEVLQRANELSRELGKPVEPGFEVFVAKSRMGKAEEREWTYIRKDGSRFPVLLSVTAMRGRSGEIIGFLGVSQDITERKQAEKDIHEAKIKAEQSAEELKRTLMISEQLRQETEEAKQKAERLAEKARVATQAKSEFLAGMSHEIRTPMNAILGMAELLDETPLNKDQSKYVQAFKGAGEALLALINDILDLSKVEAGKLDFEEIDFDLKELVESTMEIMAVRAKEKGLDLSWAISKEVPINLKGDPGRLRQIFINLMGNAIKFTEKGGVVLECRLQKTEDGGRKIEGKAEETPQTMTKSEIKNQKSKMLPLLFSVKDTGIGIPRDKLKAVFGTFTQADSSVTRKFGGTGLGLALTQRFVGKMKGKIWVESELGRGSVFFFTARFTKGEKPTRPVSAFRPDEEKHPKPEGELVIPALKILMAEDTRDNQMLVKAFLKKTPVKLDIAENGRIAVEKFKTNKYDLVLMDVQMPVMDGYTATKEIRAWEKDQGLKPTPIVALTAHAMKEDIQKSLDAGCDGHITKPIKKKKLLETILQFGIQK